MTKKELIAFEEQISNIYVEGKIHAPIHLSDGNEDQLIEIFKKIKKDDWVFSTWRSHYHALLHGVPPERVKAEILITQICLDVVNDLKRQKSDGHVWCFVGDMTAEAGLFYENAKYAELHKLPITFVIEDNGESVGTPTDVVWGYKKEERMPDYLKEKRGNIMYYQYKKKWPHVGAGKWVTF